MSFLRREKVFQVLDDTPHPKFVEKNTSVSEYLRKYGQGKVENLPQDSRTEVEDNRSVDEMLEDDASLDSMATEELDVILELERKSQDFDAMRKDIDDTESAKKEFDEAVRVIKSPQSLPTEKKQAYDVIDALVEEGKVKRVRARKVK